MERSRDIEILNHILVTGGAGYIGAHIVDLLCDKKYNVIVLDNLSSGFRDNINKKAIFIKGDILDKCILHDIFKKYNIKSIIHMAASKSVEESILNANKYTENNITGSINLIMLSIEYNVEKFIFSSTAAVYGNPQYNPIDEKHQLEPMNHYGFTKLYIENYINWISKFEKMKFIILRYFNAAGYTSKKNLIKYTEKNPENLLPIVMEVANNTRSYLNIYGNDYDTIDGTCVRDYVHVQDLADAHIKSLDFLEKNSNMTFNLSSGMSYSVKEVVDRVNYLLKKPIRFEFSDRRKGDPSILISQSDKAQKYLKWKAKYSSLDNILLSMFPYYEINKK